MPSIWALGHMLRGIYVSILDPDQCQSFSQVNDIPMNLLMEESMTDSQLWQDIIDLGIRVIVIKAP
jgi:hypothetical protein